MKLSLPDLVQTLSRLGQDDRVAGAKAAFHRFLGNVKPVIDERFADLPRTAGLGETLARGFHRSAPASPDEVRTDTGQFLARKFSNQASSRPYKLYIPVSYRGQPVPLIVMLHGCTQSPDDFAAGTRMNVMAEQHACLVVYPGQTIASNLQKCWNWFNVTDQQRDGGEPALIAGITQEVMHDYTVDPARVYVAGLSAGGAAAAIMGDAYPELYAAIGVHSGLACGAARNMKSAFAAMQNGAQGARRSERQRMVPTIVFHGEQDKTVNPVNGDAVITQSLNSAPLRTRSENGQVPGGYAYTKTLYLDTRGDSVGEQWVVQGAGHAWFGGSSAGSYTDSRGPDATAEMLRFFLAHPQLLNAR